MGYSISWVAFKNKEPEAVLESLARFRSKITGHLLPDGWYLCIAEGCDHKIVSSRFLSTATKGCSAIACSIEEHVMFSSCSSWKDGKELWNVKHEGDKALDLRISGNPPNDLTAIQREYSSKQNQENKNDPYRVDWMFEVPLQLAKQIVGFKHDEDSTGGETFEISAADRTEIGEKSLVATRPRSRWNLLILLIGLPIWGFLTLALVKFLEGIHLWIHPFQPLATSKGIGTILVVVAPLIQSIPIAMLSANYVVHLIPAARRALDEESVAYPRADFHQSQGQLVRVSLLILPFAFVASLTGVVLSWRG